MKKKILFYFLWMICSVNGQGNLEERGNGSHQDTVPTKGETSPPPVPGENRSEELEKPPPPPPRAKSKEDNLIYAKANFSKEAQYPGGLEALYAYIAKEIQYPEEALANNLEGRVYIQFVIRADGTLSHFEVIRGVAEVLDQEALRVAKNMQDWSPAEIEGEKVSVTFILPIYFRLEK